MILRKNRFITAIFLLAVFSFGFSLYAEDDIELPDLTTVVVLFPVHQKALTE